MKIKVGTALCLIVFVQASALSQSIDRSTLEALYHATGGDGWVESEGWLSDRPLDEWYGVTSRDDVVFELILMDNNLTGQLPSEIGHLRELRVLDLRWNDLHGDIPGALGNLAEIETLNLGSNDFSGLLPVELGYLQDLVLLDISYNRLSGIVPPEIGSLTQLEGLGLQHNNLTGPVPEVADTVRLDSLSGRYLYS